jgi:hypothetical protein
MDAIVYVTLSGTVFAVVISFITLYLSHLKGVDITLSVDKEKSEIDELPVDAFERDIPTNLRGKISLFVLNKGNRTGAIKITNLKFEPDETGFVKFFEKSSNAVDNQGWRRRFNKYGVFYRVKSNNQDGIWL